MILPILEVNDVDASIAFYTEKLGFTEQMKLAGPDGVTAFGSVSLGQATLMLNRSDVDNKGSGVDFMIYIPDDADIDALYADVQAKDVTLVTEVKTQYWGDRTFSLDDIDGYRITIATEVEQVDVAHIASVMSGENLA